MTEQVKENTLSILSIDELARFKKRPEEGTMKLANDIGLELINLSKKNKDFPIRLNTYERRKKGNKPQVVHVLEIDLEKPIKTD